ncbi:hypothetical protein NDU88_008312 [Pleurodeles waltl]|uniref:Uncharacterized protein n=1 Tax=Pleurodeles waltl TaxID=8319 RepID=A0AAV7NYZ9_PLEWA|nr:hypothetical protein NDU88_008312 [Pleurodeles waltl]
MFTHHMYCQGCLGSHLEQPADTGEVRENNINDPDLWANQAECRMTMEGKEGRTNRPKKPANYTRRERVAGSDVEQEEEGERNTKADIAEQEEEGERNTSITEQEKEGERNIDSGIAAQEEEGKKNTDVDQEAEGERQADTTEQEETAEEDEWWMPPETLLQPITAQKSCD